MQPGQLGHLLSESSSAATSVVAEQSPHPQPDHRLASAHGSVGQPSLVAAVHPPRGDRAPRTLDRTAPGRPPNAIATERNSRCNSVLTRHLAAAVSRMTLLRQIRALPDPAASVPTVLGFDDFALRRGHHYGNRIKMIKRQMFGRANLDLPRKRILVSH